MTKILLKGFYGFGNFGDDILMLTTYDIVRDIFPDAVIYVGSESEAPEYIHKYLANVTIVNSSANLEVDWVIHGGGGVFFDFTKHSFKFTLLNQLIRLLGYPYYRSLYKSYRKIKGDGVLKQRYRAGFGIGVGTYTPSSNRFFSDIISLSSFDILLVRDIQSVANAKRYCPSLNINMSSDLAFLNEHWNPSKISQQSNASTVGFILRDWKFNDNVTHMLEVAKELQRRGLKIKFFAFDEDSDCRFINDAKSIAAVDIWHPFKLTIEQYLNKLAECKLIVTSRAHGAIVAACLGVPQVCICIEPKLEQVAKMLKNSTELIVSPFAKERSLEVVENALANIEKLKSGTSRDVFQNSKDASRGIEIFRNFISSIK
jgi:polysaccharide pyruvyl transferase WcaK-like protein